MAANMRPLASSQLVANLSQGVRRSYTTARPSALSSRAQWTPRPTQSQIVLRQTVRRQSTEVPPPEPKKRFSWLRWTWRLTKLSAVAGAGYAAYHIYEMRNPADQEQPDPTKKTLVILGASLN